MAEVFESIGQIKESYESLVRPASLPAQGDDLPELEVDIYF